MTVVRGTALAVAAVVGGAVLAAAPPALAAAPNILSVSPAATVGLGAGQSGHPARQVVIQVDNVATTDGVTLTFPSWSGLSASVVSKVANGGHTDVTASISTSSSSTAGSKPDLTLTDTTTSSSDTAQFTVVAAPTLSSLSPTHVLRGTTTTVTIAGTGLQSGVALSAPAGSGVTFGAVALGGGSSTAGTVSVTVAPGASPGPVAVTVTNPDAGWSTLANALNVDTFAVTDVSPATASDATGNTAVALTVSGTGIPSGSTTLRLTPTFAVTGQDPIVASPTSISADHTTWQGMVNLVAAAPGSYQLQLVNGAEIGTLTSKAFTVTSAGAPTITSVTPGQVGQGTDTTITIVGTNFAHGAGVSFSKPTVTTTGSVIFDSTTQLRVPIHVASNALTGSGNAVNVTVTNTGGGSGVRNSALVITAGPTITGFSPTSLGQGAATTLTINGSNFSTTGAKAAVTFGTGVIATGAPSVTATQIKVAVKVDARPPATVSVKVQNPDLGAATASLPINAITLTAVSPRYVSKTYSGDLVLTGSGFRTGATVTFSSGSGVAIQGGKTATVSNSGATLTVPVTVSRTSPASVDVTVTNTGTDFGSVICAACLGVAVAPTAPAGAAANKAGTSATVTWTAVTSPADGGAPITGYTVTVTAPANSGVPAQSLGPTATSATFNNLATGSDYVFAVTATNQANLTSAPASATTSRRSQLDLHAGSSHVVTGQSERLFGRLLAASGAPIAGASVVVHRRSDAGVRGPVGTASTDASGRWSLITRPHVNETYTASFAGDGTNDGSASNGARVVADARVTIHGTRDPARDALTVYGRVAPDKEGETVRLVGIDANGRLHHLGRTFLNSQSRYRFHLPQPNAGWRLQVRIGATGGNGPGRSPYLLNG
jgi:hypothetical protein